MKINTHAHFHNIKVFTQMLTGEINSIHTQIFNPEILTIKTNSVKKIDHNAQRTAIN